MHPPLDFSRSEIPVGILPDATAINDNEWKDLYPVEANLTLFFQGPNRIFDDKTWAWAIVFDSGSISAYRLDKTPLAQCSPDGYKWVPLAVAEEAIAQSRRGIVKLLARGLSPTF